ncbi:HD domain-containing phosphohydrolase [Solidesulfovibrio magneticus]|uniref:Response regulator receiver protein n=1 Tax=Solidesulfovibrio magneticus (strain ATCC 700980 / DSM 13731 / RS-1) TaxID=573370 RepID=C4XTH8_SOLM1|nr:HD domain-containing phosphohydrolase [Solidesulfovibrio magneticus]BAH75975.1 response regulator receiver protein [Solidesulfovibrio magneticus RS-1]
MAILIIDDEDGLRRSLFAHLEDVDYDVYEAANGLEGWELLKQHHGEIEAVVVDLNMPVMDGYSFIAHAVEFDKEIPIVVLSGVGIVEDALSAVRLGAWDFITKPLHNMDVFDHVLKNVIERARLVRENRIYQQNLERLVRERTAEVEETRHQVMMRLSRAAEFKDNETGKHVFRVAQISRVIGQAMGMEEDHCNILAECASLHDLGKIGIPDEILLKPGRLTEQEWDIMRRHCTYGCEILGSLDDREGARDLCANPQAVLGYNDYELLRMARILALFHHERWDGTGYPFGLSGENIPLEARIVSLVDVFDALCSDRSYKKAMPVREAESIIVQGSGTQFDPQIVDVFISLKEKIYAISEQWKD